MQNAHVMQVVQALQQATKKCGHAQQPAVVRLVLARLQRLYEASGEQRKLRVVASVTLAHRLRR